jgi:hypothetical protein
MPDNDYFGGKIQYFRGIPPATISGLNRDRIK